MYLERIRNGEDAPYDEETNTVNEVKEYLDSRYICDKDSCWRVYRYDIHRHYPAVERMPVHLPDENYVAYSARANMAQLLFDPSLRKTMLIEWFVANKNNPEARDLTYCDFHRDGGGMVKQNNGNQDKVHTINRSAILCSSISG
jgi:hypothetical protein